MTTTPPDTSPPQGPTPDTGPRVGWDDIRDLARIRRSRSDRKVAGVAGGLARHLDIDPVILRVAFVVLTFFGGVGLLLYVALWLLLPEDGSDWAKIKLDRRSRTVALVVVGALALLLLVQHGWWGGGGWLFVCLVVVAAAVVVSTQLPHRGDGPPATYQGAVPPTTTPPTATPPPPSYVVPEQPRPVNPRKKGPILFWFALAVMAVALGVLGIADLAGADVAPSAYPATVLGLSAVSLLIGAFFGRAGGIILVGLVAYAVTAGLTIADRWDVDRTVARPTTPAEVQSSYRMDSGELVVDLAGISPQALDGREIHVSGDIGHLDIRVPEGLNVDAHLDIDGPGGMNAFGQDEGGFGHEMDTHHVVGADAPTLTIDAQLDIGGIDLHTEESR
ncbi:PspC domain-containing protein [Nocardioides sp.]|uniref:PspC domain-containing protein n=1 Tax=Nocardioides sp. TaxID=35761 RepID=UPI002F41080A